MAAAFASLTPVPDEPPAAAAARSRALAARQAALLAPEATTGTVRADRYAGEAIRPSRIPVTRGPAGLQRCGDHPCTGDCGSHRAKLRASVLPGREVDPGASPEITDTVGIAEVLRAPGAPLDAQTRTHAESYFGRSFADVRIHTDTRAAATSGAVGARAYTVGTHLVFGRAQYAPRIASGARLLAHELTHVVQQSDTAAAAAPRLISDDGDPSELEAERISAGLAVGLTAPQPHATAGPAAVSERSGPHVARDGVKDEIKNAWERVRKTAHEVREGIGRMALPHGCRPVDKMTELPALTAVFGTSVDFARVCISDALGYDGRPFTLYVGGGLCVINAGPGIYKTPGSIIDTLIHEMTHVWQSQHHTNPAAYITNSLASQAKWGGDCYCYVPGKAFREYGAEQIAQQVERGEAAIRAHVKSVPTGAVDPDNVIGLATPRGEPPGTAGRKC